MGTKAIAGNNAIPRVWNHLKMWRKINIGPLSILFKFDRRVRVVPASNKSYIRPNNPAVPDSMPQSSGLASALPLDTALIVGVGPGFGYALARRLAREGYMVLLASRNASHLEGLLEEIAAQGGVGVAYGCDATQESSVLKLFECIQEKHGIPDLVVYSLQSFGPGQSVDIAVSAFEDGWKHNCLGAFLVARSAARAMLPRERGSIVLVGSTSSMLGRAGHLNLAVGKFGQRALAQVLARELWPKGLHVAHVVIDADIDEGAPVQDGIPQSDPNHIAQIILQLHHQPKSAWASEIDVRPWNEQFWEHC